MNLLAKHNEQIKKEEADKVLGYNPTKSKEI